MAGTAGYSISISAVDKTTAVLDRINSKLAGSQRAINQRLEAASAPMKRMQTQLNRTMNLLGGGKLASGVGDVSKKFESLTRSSFGAFNNIARLVDPLTVIGSATTVAGIAALERRFASLSQTLTNTGRLMNMDPAKLAQWENAVRLTGGTAGDADSSLRSMENAMSDARFGKNNDLASRLQVVEGSDWYKKSEDIGGTVMAVSRYLQTLKGANRSAALRNYQSAFGWTDGFTSMVAQGPEAIQKYLKQSKAHGSMTDSQIGAGDNLAKSLNAAQQSIEGVANAITGKLAGPIQKIVDAFTRWTDKNRDLIAQHLAQTIEDIGRRIAAVNLKPLEDFAARMDRLVKSTVGWQKAIEGGIGILVASKVAGIALPFVRLADAIGILSGSGPRSFGALGKALRAIGFGVVGGDLVKLGVQEATGSQGAGTVAGDATTGAIMGGAMFGPVGAGIGGALGAAYGGYEVHKANKAAQAARADDMVAYYRSQGLSAVQAAALVGGFQQESGLDPAASNDQGGGHYGIAQWDQSRQADFKAMFGHDIRQSTLQEQMQFALQEMFNGKEGEAGRKLLAAKTADQATDAALSYERPAAPGTPAWQNEHGWRLGYTTDILARQKDGAKYLPPVDAGGNPGAYPVDNEPTRLIGETMPGTGMDREDRTSVLEVHTYDHRTEVKVRKKAPNTHIRTTSPLPAGGP